MLTACGFTRDVQLRRNFAPEHLPLPGSQGSDAREMVMMSLVHEHGRAGSGAGGPVKRARLGSQPITPLFTGALFRQPAHALHPVRLVWCPCLACLTVSGSLPARALLQVVDPFPSRLPLSTADVVWLDGMYDDTPLTRAGVLGGAGGQGSGSAVNSPSLGPVSGGAPAYAPRQGSGPQPGPPGPMSLVRTLKAGSSGRYMRMTPATKAMP